jgi:hypothetical protein
VAQCAGWLIFIHSWKLLKSADFRDANYARTAVLTWIIYVGYITVSSHLVAVEIAMSRPAKTLILYGSDLSLLQVLKLVLADKHPNVEIIGSPNRLKNRLASDDVGGLVICHTVQPATARDIKQSTSVPPCILRLGVRPEELIEQAIGLVSMSQ